MGISDDEIHTRYADYERGFIHGASGASYAALLGTRAPTFLKDFEEGKADGQRALRDALGKHWAFLTWIQKVCPHHVDTPGKQDDDTGKD